MGLGISYEHVTESNVKNGNVCLSCAGSDGKGEVGDSWAGFGSSFAEKQDKGDRTRRR